MSRRGFCEIRSFRLLIDAVHTVHANDSYKSPKIQVYLLLLHALNLLCKLLNMHLLLLSTFLPTSGLCQYT